MVIFLNGSINAGKSTVGRLLAKRLGADFIEFDDISDKIPNFNLSTDLPVVIGRGIEQINKLTGQGKNVVAAYPLRKIDQKRLQRELTGNLYLVTLKPPLKTSLTNRGTRELTAWETQRIKYHYRQGLNSPAFGIVIDNGDHSAAETANEIIRRLELAPVSHRTPIREDSVD